MSDAQLTATGTTAVSNQQPSIAGANAMDKNQIIIEAWKQTIAVQMHFNDLELRIRSYGLTTIAAIVGLAGLDAAVVHTKVNILIIFAALVIWLAFFLMDLFWYHPFLKAAVKHGEAIEKLEKTAPAMNVDWPPHVEYDEKGEPKQVDKDGRPKLVESGSLLGLTHCIAYESSHNFLGAHSTTKMVVFYLIVWAGLWVIFIAATIP